MNELQLKSAEANMYRNFERLGLTFSLARLYIRQPVLKDSEISLKSFLSFRMFQDGLKDITPLKTGS